MTFRFKLLHHFTCQIEACGAVAWDGEDEGFWRFPGAEVFVGDGGGESSRFRLQRCEARRMRMFARQAIKCDILFSITKEQV